MLSRCSRSFQILTSSDPCTGSAVMILFVRLLSFTHDSCLRSDRPGGGSIRSRPQTLNWVQTSRKPNLSPLTVTFEKQPIFIKESNTLFEKTSLCPLLWEITYQIKKSDICISVIISGFKKCYIDHLLFY